MESKGELLIIIRWKIEYIFAFFIFFLYLCIQKWNVAFIIFI